MQYIAQVYHCNSTEQIIQPTKTLIDKLVELIMPGTSIYYKSNESHSLASLDQELLEFEQNISTLI